MSAIRELIKSHGGSFEKIPNKACFWMPLEAKTIINLAAELQAEGRQIKFVRFERGWNLYRFVGERKPYKVIRVHDRTATNNVNEDLIVRIDKNGVVEVREKGRRVGFTTTVAAIYVRCMMNEVFKRQMAKAKAKKDKKKARRK